MFESLAMQAALDSMALGALRTSAGFRLMRQDNKRQAPEKRTSEGLGPFGSSLQSHLGLGGEAV